MNYSGVKWTTKTAITKTDLDTMDAGIKAASEEINKISSSVIALKNSNIQRGYEVFPKGTELTNKIAKRTVTVEYPFSANATIVAVANTSHPDFYNVSVSRIDKTFDKFDIYMHVTGGAVSASNTMKYDLGIHWIIIS